MLKDVYGFRDDEEEAEPAFVNEYAALQTAFDLEWIRLQVGFDAEVDRAARELKEKLLEVHIDPVNWALYEQHFAKSFEAFRSRSALFALGSGKPQAKEAANGLGVNGAAAAGSETNLVPLKGSIPRIPLLPVPSTMRVSRRPNARRSSSARMSISKAKGVSGQKGIDAEMSSEQGSVRDAAIATVTKVGSNILSQYSSYFN